MKRLALIGLLCLSMTGCQGCWTKSEPISLSGVKEVRPKVTTGEDGMTNEQRNIVERYKMDNEPGSIKHLYMFSSYSGDTLLYSTVKGKVTSSGKRVSPTSVCAGDSPADAGFGPRINVNGRTYRTSEMIQDDGTYGSSIEYLYWFDVNGNYRQVYPSAGSIIVVSNSPLQVKKPIVNVEVSNSPKN